MLKEVLDLLHQQGRQIVVGFHVFVERVQRIDGDGEDFFVDALFIIHGEAPAKSNDYPRHDADRVAIARVLDEEACRRLVACWNACENVSTGDLEAMKRSADLSWVMTIDILVRQRDGLRAAAQSLVDQVAGGDFDHIGADHPSSAVHSVRTAIAWAEGGAS